MYSAIVLYTAKLTTLKCNIIHHFRSCTQNLPGLGYCIVRLTDDRIIRVIRSCAISRVKNDNFAHPPVTPSSSHRHHVLYFTLAERSKTLYIVLHPQIVQHRYITEIYRAGATCLCLSSLTYIGSRKRDDCVV